MTRPHAHFVKTFRAEFTDGRAVAGSVGTTAGTAVIQLEKAVDETDALGLVIELLPRVYLGWQKDGFELERVGRHFKLSAATQTVFVLPILDDQRQAITIVVWDHADSGEALRPVQRVIVH